MFEKEDSSIKKIEVKKKKYERLLLSAKFFAKFELFFVLT